MIDIGGIFSVTKISFALLLGYLVFGDLIFDWPEYETVIRLTVIGGFFLDLIISTCITHHNRLGRGVPEHVGWIVKIGRAHV